MRRPAPAAWPKRILLGADPVRRTIYVGGMVPAIWYFYLGLTDQLGADPQKTLERELGLWALRFLIASLAISPLRRLGGPNLIRYRRAVGLLAFCYAALHLTVYLALDQSMLLLALANHLRGGVIQQRFAADPIAAAALPLLADEDFFD